MTNLRYRHKVCTAHRLMGHPGQCKYLHGHTYEIRCELAAYGEDCDTADMVMDFRDVKRVVGGILDDRMDHATILEDTDPLVEVLRNCPPSRLWVITGRPTAEILAEKLLEEINNALAEAKFEVVCVTVEVFEGDGQSAYAWSE